MRIIVFLKPTNKRGTKTAYTKLRKFLIADGYQLVGPELYMRISPDRNATEKHLRRMKEHNPGSGTVFILKLTEKQFEKIWFLTGEKSQQEKLVGPHCHIAL